MSDKKALVEKILSTPKRLSDDQRKAVLSESRYSRIIAGAGAGKTETLTRRIVYLLAVKEVPPSEIVAFTFTEKAAQSMKSRVYQRVGEICGEKATANLGEMYIGTIHAMQRGFWRIISGLGTIMCWMIIRRLLFYCGMVGQWGFMFQVILILFVFVTFFGPLTWFGMSS